MPSGLGSAPPTKTCRRRSRVIGRRSSRASPQACRQCATCCSSNVVQSANLKPWQIGLTVTQTLFNGFKTANSVRVAELQVIRPRGNSNVGQGVLLDAVTAHTNVLANQSLVEAQRANVAFLRETQGIAQKRLNAGDVTPTDMAQAEARLNRGLADLNAAEVSLAISQATYTQVIGNAPAQLRPAETVDRYLASRSRDDATNMAFRASRGDGRKF